MRHVVPLSLVLVEFGNVAKMPLCSHIWRLLGRKGRLGKGYFLPQGGEQAVVRGAVSLADAASCPGLRAGKEVAGSGEAGTSARLSRTAASKHLGAAAAPCLCLRSSHQASVSPSVNQIGPPGSAGLSAQGWPCSFCGVVRPSRCGRHPPGTWSRATGPWRAGVLASAQWARVACSLRMEGEQAAQLVL